MIGCRMFVEEVYRFGFVNVMVFDVDGMVVVVRVLVDDIVSKLLFVIWGIKEILNDFDC